jgi:hypothetical protein
MGIASKGLQVLLPIAPDLLLLAFDREFYRVGNRKQGASQLERPEDCDLINALQILNAEANFYFLDEHILSKVRELSARFSRLRERVAESGRPLEYPIRGTKGGFAYVNRQPLIPNPGVWSFCKRRKPVTRKEFGVRDPLLCRLIEEHTNYLKKTGHLISFDDWLEQQGAESSHRNPLFFSRIQGGLLRSKSSFEIS